MDLLFPVVMLVIGLTLVALATSAEMLVLLVAYALFVVLTLRGPVGS